MRLINAATLQLEEFENSSARPDYAILSHRWAHGEEVSFHDMKGAHRQWMPGWSKIVFCCRQALQDGLTHAWVDTCCIDKDSSAELSEAINSMYEWYSNARVCYAYLNDVDTAPSNNSKDISLSTRIAESLWFTRAWTR
ncbi:HET-domain-containing protein [Xylariaceae sp. FL1272]|nr:HET-domain-containing protein [Xylariaceae sp. FL1272]